MKRVILYLISLLPIASMAFAAKAKTRDLKVSDAFSAKRAVAGHTYELFFNETNVVGVEDAYGKYVEQYGAKLGGEKDFENLIFDLETRGLIENRGEFIISRTPSNISRGGRFSEGQ